MQKAAVVVACLLLNVKLLPPLPPHFFLNTMMELFDDIIMICVVKNKDLEVFKNTCAK